ncbi:pentatricopeptide repeat-containing protein At4g17616 [Euphorbia lathyris]|uniref:pentatricopeptide repeat-containing protein At4g17616 n=1 Tax=Euphorbia lathyris TaxID=212925 RepID=UPI003314141A
MALVLTRKIVLQQHINKIYSHGFIMVSSVQKIALCSHNNHKFLVNNKFRRFQVLDAFCKQHHFMKFQSFSTGSQPESIRWGCSSHAVLLRKLEVSLKDRELDEAWLTFNDFKSLYGFPTDFLVSRLITELSYSSDPHWLQKASDLVSQILKEKSKLLKIEVLTKLSLSLARAQLAIPSSMILSAMLDRENMPQLSVLHLMFFHMVKTEIGACLASNLLIQICDRYLNLSVKKADLDKVIKPDTMMFNLILNACVRWKSSLKGQILVEWMSRIGVIADAHSIISIAHIYEINGLRDEMNKFKDYINQVSAPFVCHYQQFYDCLLSLHFKFDELDAAAELVIDLNRFSVHPKKPWEGTKKPYLVPIGSKNLKAELKLQIVPELLQKDSVIKGDYEKELVISRNGKLLLSNRAVAKLIHGYRRHGIITELTNVLLSLQKNFQTLAGSGLCSDVINACICLGWLDTAHDILDDMERGGFPVDSSTYMRLLRAYYSREMFKEADALLTQIRKNDLLENLSSNMVAADVLSEIEKDESFSVTKSHLADVLVEEIREEEKALPTILYELNSSIYFFCQAKMIEDAIKTYRRMQVRGIKPTEHTFTYLIRGYSSVERFRDITILWGDIKRNMKSQDLVVSRDLFELLLVKFIQGGYFERVMEIIGYMKEHNMYIDKCMYKSEFLKLHRHLYKRLKTRTVAQRKRLEFVLAFKKWAGID